MGIRMTQPYGLPKEAQVFLEQHAMRMNRCEHCGRDDGYEREQIGTTGMFDDLKLWRYTLTLRSPDGTPLTATERVQREVWSSGPMIWLCLVVDDDAVFEWDSKDMTE